MKSLHLAALAVIALACTPANAAPRAPDDAPRLVLTIAPGDTARFAFSYTAGARATGALRSVRATATFPPGPWLGLPTDLPGAASGVVTAVATNATADSADFIACVKWTNSGGQTPELCSSSARWRRRPGQGTVTWDSVVAIRLLPDSGRAFAYLTVETPNTAGLQGTQVQFCPVTVYVGAAALPVGYQGLGNCTALFLQERARRGWNVASSGQQQLADLACWTMTTTSGTFPGPALWQARRYTAAELAGGQSRTELVTIGDRDCGTFPPGTTVGVARYLNGEVLAMEAWLTVVG